MAFTRDQVEEFIEALQRDAELRERVRAAILADDFLALPGLVRANTEAIAALTERVDALTIKLDAFIEAADVRFTRLEKRMDDVAGRLGNVEGDVFEARFVRNIRSHIGPRFRRPQPLDVYSDEVVEAAMAKSPLSPVEMKDVALADALVWTTDSDSGERAALVIEVSRTVDIMDVIRANRRAKLLAKAGLNVFAVVAGATASTEAMERATDLSVVVLVQQPEPAA